MRAQNGGTLPPEKVEELYRTFSCEFGCPHPRMPAETFLDMAPVPRPKEPPGVSGKYLSFQESYDKDTPFCAPALDNGAAVEVAPSGTTTGENVRAVIQCSVCPHKRAVYTKTKIANMKVPGEERNGQEILADFLDNARTSYVCGDDLGETAANDTTEVVGCLLKGAARPYVRLKLFCSSSCETQLYTMKPPRPLTDADLKAMCSIYDESGRIMQELAEDCLPEGAFLPTCRQCYAQHNSFRPSRRTQTTRYDRSGQREVSSVFGCFTLNPAQNRATARPRDRATALLTLLAMHHRSEANLPKRGKIRSIVPRVLRPLPLLRRQHQRQRQQRRLQRLSLLLRLNVGA